MSSGILLLNMGGPNSVGEVEVFLRNMFSDPRILPMNSILRRIIGKRIIKNRLVEAERNYEQLGGKSPLTEISISLAKKVEAITGVPTRLAMRYVPPFADDALAEFKKNGINEVIVFPMYPQYSTTTTLSSLDDLYEKMDKLGYDTTLKIIEPYFDDSGYIDIITNRIEAAVQEIDSSQYDLILSAHGLPVSIVEAGDPYQKQIEASVDRVKRALKEKNIIFADTKLAYQSKVGKSAWLEPNLTDVLRDPANTKVVILPLAFTIDNSETLFELDIEHREIADKIGYDDYRVVSCPNDGDDFAEFITKRVRETV
jgi:ferrochelatase